ncbi:MAG TPA: ABC transporter substrate-binding protein [Conexibacter sp.]|nr:ABC transporter substrate-binding protein [Conexibacter sp.]
MRSAASSVRYVLLAVAAVAALALSACGGGDKGGSGGSTASSGDSGGTIKLGFDATLTGDFASYGLMIRDGANLAIEQLNADGGVDGKQLEMSSQDDQGQPSNGVTNTQKLCDDKDVRAVLGWSFSSVALAAVPVLTQCRLPAIGSATTSPRLSGISPYFFRNTLTDAAQGVQMGAHAADLGFRNVAVLNGEDDFGVGTSDSFIKGFQDAGGTIAYRAGFQPGTTDFQTQIAKVKAANADALYIGGFYSDAARIAKQARAAGYDGQLLSTDGALAPDLIRLGGDAVDGMLLYSTFVPGIPTPKVQDFVKAFDAKYGEKPTSAAALGYDAVFVIKQAIEAGGDSREGIAKALANSDWDGITGVNAFDDKHDRVAKILFIKVAGGDFVPADAK